MKLRGVNIDFPAKMNLSFALLIDELEAQIEKSERPQAEHLRSILTMAARFPQLRNGIPEGAVGEYQEAIDMLMWTIFPYALRDNEIKCASSPWDFEPIYSSDRLKRLIERSTDGFALDLETFDEDALYISGCSFILNKYYNMPIKASRPFYMDMVDKETGNVSHFRLGINADYLDIRPTDQAKVIGREDFEQLVDNFHDIGIWKEKFPEDSWIFSGFTIINLMDLTEDRRINEITYDLLETDPEVMNVLRDNISDLLEIEDLKLSFVTLQGRTLTTAGLMSDKMMMGDREDEKCDSILCPYTYEELIVHNKPVGIPDVPGFNRRSDSVISHNLVNAGLGSYYVSPVIYAGKTLGFLELGSADRGVLNTATSVQLEQVLPVLAVAGNRYNQELTNRIEAAIQEECTTIHSSVKWRFVEEAILHIEAQDAGEHHNFTDLVFKDVYPLFGQMDIRSSSRIRNNAVKKDLVGQLKSVESIVVMAKDHITLPVYDMMLYRTRKFISSLKDSVNAASEHDIMQFLGKEVDPILPHLIGQSKELKKAIKRYESDLHDEYDFMYKERRAFDESVNSINKLLSTYLDHKQMEAQEMFPHYFERYKTDGVEFNMYIGESIAPEMGFSPLMVRNLRLWQLMVMVEMEREFRKLQGILKKQLEVASLILAYSTPLSIQFRMDEKRFDVEGAYNARYEVIKKRVDKAHIIDTDERITQPDKLAIVYTREQDEIEYRRYIRFLQAKGYLLSGPPEVLVVEDLQGVVGLKALRVAVDFGDDKEPDVLTMEEIMEEIRVN